MKGIELSRGFFEAYGRDMLEREFGEYIHKIAVGLIGQGSERYGFDDEYSRDHDFCAGFCIFTDEKTDEKIGFELMSAYRRLPKEFSGVSTRESVKTGDSRYGVVTYDRLFLPLLGENYKSLTAMDYLSIPQNYFADATNGEIFYDVSGHFTEIYNGIKNGMPMDVRLKKISANAAMMAQSGQYNYARCLSHKESGAAVLALGEFVKSTSAIIYLLNGEFMPYYKWMLKGLRRLAVLGDMADSLEFLLTGDNDYATTVVKSEIIEAVSGKVIKELQSRGLTDSDSDYLEDHARSVACGIQDVNIRNMHILYGAD